MSDVPEWFRRAMRDLNDLRAYEDLAEQATKFWEENARRNKEKSGEEEGFSE